MLEQILHHCMLGKKFYLQGFGKKILTETKVTFLLTNLNPDFPIRNLIFRSIGLNLSKTAIWTIHLRTWIVQIGISS